MHQLTQRFSAAATIDLRGANYSDWQLCLNEEEARGPAVETRWVGWGGRNGGNYADEERLIGFSYRRFELVRSGQWTH